MENRSSFPSHSQLVSRSWRDPYHGFTNVKVARMGACDIWSKMFLGRQPCRRWVLRICWWQRGCRWSLPCCANPILCAERQANQHDDLEAQEESERARRAKWASKQGDRNHPPFLSRMDVLDEEIIGHFTHEPRAGSHGVGSPVPPLSLEKPFKYG